MAELVAVAVIGAAVAGHPLLPADREVARLRAHFAQVDLELTARDVSHLTPPQRQARQTHIDRLRAYAAAGQFPKNTHHPGEYVPYFVDDRGTRCAMGFLIEQSGSGEFVNRVRQRLNFAYIADIASDPELGPELRVWLEANGLSLDEAARIQPGYDGPSGDQVPAGYKVASAVAIVGGLASVAFNVPLVDVGLSRSVTGLMGVVTGGTAIALAASATDKGHDATLLTFNVVVGFAALGGGVYALMRPDCPRDCSRAESRLAGSPWMAPDGRPGVLLNYRF